MIIHMENILTKEVHYKKYKIVGKSHLRAHDAICFSVRQLTGNTILRHGVGRPVNPASCCSCCDAAAVGHVSTHWA